MVKRASRKFDLKQLENEIQIGWDNDNIYEKVKDARKGGKKYYFLDGPPYASGSIHLGTAYNKILKDSIIRFLSMRGYNVRRQAGWDCHGLPIEVKVEERLGINNKKEIERLGIENFVKECKSWAFEHINIMEEQFKRLGVWMDWSMPYMTLTDGYIESAWWTIKQAHKKGLLTNNLQVVTWCPRCETALAEAEIEYKDRSDPSVYVKFPIEGRENEYLLIWTTTPWTLIANLAVMVHPEFEYARVSTEAGTLILAKEQIPIIKDCFGLDYKILETFIGSNLEGLKYSNPLSNQILIQPNSNAYKVILADIVNLDEGTGCVHSAPGHGPEDFYACAKYGIDPFCPVDERGKFTADAGKYMKMRVKKDDNIIIQDLGDALVHSEELSHRYGHCWRCKTPIIYRATKQWFIAIDPIKKKMLKEIEHVDWVPDWAGSSRFKDWVKNARDWTISRQRYWGIPLPIWLCEDCGDLKVISSKDEIRKFGFQVKELHKPYVDEIKIKCDCGGIKKRVPDVLDVWFDSGVAAWASLNYPSKVDEFKRWGQADFITEGHDQTRGWFYSQLGCGIIAFDKTPYLRVLMHGFALDEKGEKMSKSVGNIVNPKEVIDKYGVDILRFYSLWANKPWDDLKFKWEEVRVVQKLFNVLWNTYVFATTYMEIDSYDPSKGISSEKYYQLEDKWILSRLHSLLKEINGAFNSLEINRATRSIQNFILEDLSRWYIPLIRSRTWVEKDNPTKLASYEVLFEILLRLSISMAPITPHLSESIFQNLTNIKKSVHMEDWVEGDEKKIKLILENDMNVVRKYVEAEAHAREKCGIKRRWPVISSYFYPNAKKSATALQNLEKLVIKIAPTLDFKIVYPKKKFKGAILKLEPNMHVIGPEFKENAGKIINHLKNVNVAKIKRRLNKGYNITISGEIFTINEKHVNFIEGVSDRYSTVDFEFGTVYIDTLRNEKVMIQGYSREVVRRIQQMRKDLDLDIEAFINVNVRLDNSKIIKLLNSKEAIDYISNETRSKKMKISNKIELNGYEKNWRIDGEDFIISLKELKSAS